MFQGSSAVEVKARKSIIEVELCVFGWGDEDYARNRDLTKAVINYVHAGFVSGMDSDEIETDIVDHFSDRLEDADIQIRGVDDVLVVLVEAERGE